MDIYIQKIRAAIILFIKKMIEENSNYKTDLLFYNDFYENIFSKVHFYKLINDLIYIRKMVLSRDVNFKIYDPIFTIIQTGNKINILEKLWVSNDETIIWKYYLYFVKTAFNFCKDHIFPELPNKEGFVINYDKLNQLIKIE